LERLKESIHRPNTHISCFVLIIKDFTITFKTCVRTLKLTKRKQCFMFARFVNYIVTLYVRTITWMLGGNISDTSYSFYVQTIELLTPQDELNCEALSFFMQITVISI